MQANLFRFNLLIALLLICNPLQAATLSRGQTFGASETVTNTKLHNLVDNATISGISNGDISNAAAIAYSKLALTGGIVNADISASAAIAYSKLNLATSIVNADISASAAIVGSKLDLTSPGAIGSTAANTGAFSTLKVGTTNQGDILYDNGTSLVRLTPGTSGQFLKTQGAAANPLWASQSPSALTLVSTTTFSGAVNSGNISITSGKFYIAKVVATSTGGGGDSWGVRFNADATSNSYSLNGGAFNATKITIGSFTVGGGEAVSFDIRPGVNNSNVYGQHIGATGAVQSVFYGAWNAGTATSFQLISISGVNIAGTVYLYEVSQT